MILTVLFFQIISSLTKLKAANKQPPIFWLQLDNTSKENKNKWTLAFCSWLIKIGWFYEVVISFLPPGHTHVDIDQMFSTYSIWLLRHSLEFITSLVPHLQDAYKTNIPGGCFLPVVYNWKGFFAPHLRDLLGISQPHVFLLRKQLNDDVGIKFKKWHTTNDVWVGPGHNTEQWLSLMISYPSG